MVRVGWELLIAAGGWAGHRSVGGETLYCASLGFLGFYSSFITIIIISIIIFYLVSIIKLLLSQSMGFTFFPILFPTWGWW